MYKFDDSRFFCDINDGQAIIIDSATGIYFSMSPFSTQVFEALGAGAAPADIAAKLEGFGASADTSAKLDEFVSRLKEREILTDGTASSPPPIEINADQAKGSDFSFTFDEYNNMQEMLVIDPVHDVSADGWKPVLA
ncbi:MAG: PqqD family protein [Alphaproteobacteria bacterium]|nr:PqqD family protein [Alphaproteobacteria bacterium]